MDLLFYFNSLKDEAALKKLGKHKVIATNKDGIKFQTDTLVEASDEYQGIHESYENAQKSIVDEVLRISGEFCVAHVILLSHNVKQKK